MRVEAHFDDKGLTNLYGRMPSEIDKAVRQATQELGGMVRRELAGRESLTKYPRHNGSSPGPPGGMPAQRTSRLARSIKEEPIRRVGFAHYSRTVLSDMSYAAYVEEGTEHMAARPFMRLTFDRLFTHGKALTVYNNRLDAILRTGGKR